MPNRSNILVTSDGLPLYIYVQKDANEVLREAQVLYLKSMGAVIVDDLEVAFVVIILDLRLPSAATLICDYAEGPGAPARISPKIVIKHQWIEACLTSSSRIPWDNYRILRPSFSALEEEGSTLRKHSIREQFASSPPPSRDNDHPSHTPSQAFTLPSLSNLLMTHKSKPSNAKPEEFTNDSTRKRKISAKEMSKQMQTNTARVDSSRSREKSPEPPELEADWRGHGYAWTDREDKFLVKYVKWGFKNGLWQSEIARRLERKLTVTQRNSASIELRITHLKKKGRLTAKDLVRQTANRTIFISSVPLKKRRLGPTAARERAVAEDSSQSEPDAETPGNPQRGGESGGPPKPPDPSTFEVPPRGRGYVFTEADRQFIAEYADWMLCQKPKTTLYGLSTKAGELAPHHGKFSWYEHLRNHQSEYIKRAPWMIPLFKGRAANGTDSFESSIIPLGITPLDGDVDEQNYSEPEAPEPHAKVERRFFNDDEKRDMAAFIAQHPSIWYGGKAPDVPDEEPLARRDAWNIFDQSHSQYGRTAKSWEHYYRRNSDRLEEMAWDLAKGKGISGSSHSIQPFGRAVPAPTTPTRRAGPSRIPRDGDTEQNGAAEARSRKESYTNQDWDALVDYLADHPVLMKNSPRRAQGSATKGVLWERFAGKHPRHSVAGWRQYYSTRQDALDAEAAARVKAPDFEVREQRDSVNYNSSDEEADVSAGPSKRRVVLPSATDGASSDMAVEDLVDEKSLSNRRPSPSMRSAERDKASEEAEAILERRLRLKAEH